MGAKRVNWSWLEALMERIPAHYLLASSLLFILLFSIYYLFSWNVTLFKWLIRIEDESIHVVYYEMRYISQSLAQSFLVPYLIAGLIYLSEKTRETFRYLDMLFENPKKDCYGRIEASVIGAKGYHMLLFLFVITPFMMISWGQWDYHYRDPGNWAWGLDIYSYLLSFLILALLTELLWLMGNIVWSVNEIGCIPGELSESINVFGIGMKLRPLRNYFLVFIVYYFIAMALLIYTYISPSDKMTIEPIYFGVLLVIGGMLFVAGLETVQRIIDCRVENELDILNNRREKQDHRLIEIVSSGNPSEKVSEVEYISKVLDIIQKERDSLLQINRRAYDVTSVSLFISSFLIPLLTLLEKFGFLHT